MVCRIHTAEKGTQDGGRGRKRKGLNATAVEHPHPCKRRNYSNYIARVLRQRFFSFPSSVLALFPLLPYFPLLFFFFSFYFSFSSLSLPSPSPPSIIFLVHDSQITDFYRHISIFFLPLFFSLFSLPSFHFFLVHDSHITGFYRLLDGSSFCQRSRMRRFSNFFFMSFIVYEDIT